MPRRVVRRRGRGIFGSVGSWLGEKAGDRLGASLGFGRKRRVRRRVGGAMPFNSGIRLAVMPNGIVRYGGRRRRMVRRRGGFSIPDWLKPTLTNAKEALAEKAAHFVGTKINPAAGRWLQRGAYHLGNALGFGRRRKRRVGGRSYSRLLL